MKHSNAQSPPCKGQIRARSSFSGARHNAAVPVGTKAGSAPLKGTSWWLGAATLWLFALCSAACSDEQDGARDTDELSQDGGGDGSQPPALDAAMPAETPSDGGVGDNGDAGEAPDAGGAPARQGLLAYESFEYPAGGIAGRSGGFGFVAAWTGGGSVVEEPFDYSAAGQTVTQAGALLGVTTSSTTRDLDVSELPATLSDTPGKIGAAGQAVWLSMLAQSSSAIPEGAWAGLQLFDGDTEQRFVGAPFFSEDPQRKQSWGMDRPGLGGTPIYTDTPVEMPSLLVVRIDFGVEITGGETATGARMSLWANPALAAEENLGPADAVLDGPDFRFNRLRIGGEYSGLQLDELRVGETFADVVPAQAQTSGAYVEEGFAYAVGPLLSRSGGMGWAGGWSSPDTTTSKFQLVEPGLTYMSGELALRTSGASIRASSGPPAGRPLVSQALPTSLSDTAGSWGAPGTELWIAFLARAPGLLTPTGQFAGLSLHLGGYTDASQHLFIGAPYYNEDDGRLPHWGMDRPGLELPLYTDMMVTTSTTLIVARVQFGTPASDSAESTATVSLWVDPQLGSTLAEPQLTLVRDDFRFNSVTVNANVEGFEMDELRMGPSLESVCPTVP